VLPILESLIPGYAAAMLEAQDAGDYDDLRRMLDLLEALGGPVMSELTEKNPEESRETYLQEGAVVFDPRLEIGHADEEEYRKHPHHGPPLSHFHLLGRVRGLGAGLGLGAVLSLPPSLLLDHDSDRGCQT